MNKQYQNIMNELIRWINNIDSYMKSGIAISHTYQEVQQVTKLIVGVVEYIKDEYPYYAELLPRIANHLFITQGYAPIILNTATYGELYIIINHVNNEPVDTRLWSDIHPRIVSYAKPLFCDGHYDSAAEKALKEVESKLREKFSELKPNSAVPAKASEIISALFSENGIFHYCDTSTVSGKNYRRGIQNLFDGFIAAYRNPSAHENLSYTRREALEQIVLSSQLMYVLDKPEINHNTPL